MKCCSRFTDMESMPEKKNHLTTKDNAKQKDVKPFLTFDNVFLICLEILVCRDDTHNR